LARVLPPDLAEAVRAGGALIVGLGREGLSTYRFLRREFPDARIALADREKPTELDAEVGAIPDADPFTNLLTGPTYLDRAGDSAVIFRSPGIRPDLPELVRAAARGTRLSSNTELFFALRPGRIVGVTGTKGKSTTSAVVHAVLSNGGLPSKLLGNIGVPPLSALEEDLDEEELFVAELSSFQLSTLSQSPNISVIQNVVPEHLDYHGAFAGYVDSKRNIVRFQGPEDWVIHDADHPLPAEIAAASPGHRVGFGLSTGAEVGCFVEDAAIVTTVTGVPERVIGLEEIPLLGRFNVMNVMPAVVIGRLVGVPSEAIADAIRRFRPLEHRLERVADVAGVEYFDDSVATLPDATQAALGAFSGKPVVLIAGGYDRGLDYSGLAASILEAGVRALILFPPTGLRLWKEMRAIGSPPPVEFVETMAEAVRAAAASAPPGGVVLMSPASASFGRFVDYRDRGDQFKAEVHKLDSPTHSDD
jgi:UDP-N-acetylmuramoylalanine--D-glutamate ligase